MMKFYIIKISLILIFQTIFKIFEIGFINTKTTNNKQSLTIRNIIKASILEIIDKNIKTLSKTKKSEILVKF